MSDTLLLDAIYNSAGDITNIRHRIPGYTGCYPKYTPVLKPKTNIISTLKQFRVQRDEFSVLSDILSIISLPSSKADRDEYRTFQLTDRQGSFTNKYLVTGLGSSIQITNPITIHLSPGTITFSINIIPQTKLSYIRHELINPLHTIKLSSALIRERELTYKDKSDVDKLGDLISTKVDESLNLLDGLLAMGTPRLDPVSIQTFITYINEYIATVNQTYAQEIKPTVIWPDTDKSQFIVHHNDAPNLDFRYGTDVDVRPRYDKSAPHGTATCSSQLAKTIATAHRLASGTIYVNTCYIKIILDNVFKNIFGHLDNRISDRAFRDFTVKIESTSSNRINKSPMQSHMYIIIRNRILDSTARHNQPSDSPTPFVFNKLSSTSKLQGIYHLDPSSIHQPVNQPVSQKELRGDRLRGGSGIRLIDELCKKMNIKWELDESDDCEHSTSTSARGPIVSFTLKIPISHSVHLKNVHAHGSLPKVLSING